MTAHAFQRHYQRQPDAPQVARGNPLCDSLVYAATPVGIQFIDGAANQKSTIAAGTPTIKSGFAGRIANVDGSSYYTAARRGSYIPTTASPHTMAVLCRPTSLGSPQFQSPLSIGSVAATQALSQLFIDNTVSNTWSWADGSSGISSGVIAVANTPTLFAVATKAANSRILMVNGNITTSSTNITSNACSSGISIGVTYAASSPDTTTAFIGDIALCVLWNRALTSSELRSLYQNPWQIFGVTNRRHWPIAAVAAGGFKPYWASQRSQVIGAGVM